MSLTGWQRYGWVVPKKPSAQEIAELLTAADRDLADCDASGLSPDWRLNIAHNAAMLIAAAALAASGYRVSGDAHRYRTLQSLEETVAAPAAMISRLNSLRRKRSVSSYERAGLVSSHEADEMAGPARQVRQMVIDWLQAQHPEFLNR